MKTFIVDAFTREEFKGNPAGVCMVENAITEAKMQSIANELNLSETAFVRRSDKPNTYSIRFFSPKMEIPLCGHATLASARIIFEMEGLDEVHFITIKNLDLLVRNSTSGITMEFPVYEVEPATAPQALLEALGLKEIENCVYNRETNILLIEIASAEKLSGLSPDFNLLIKSHNSINGVLVTARSGDAKSDFHSRFFWPWSGGNEDPVTGSTHTFLAKYWSKKLNKKKMNSFQASERTGQMEVDLAGDAKLLIKSNAVIVFEGRLRI